VAGFCVGAKEKPTALPTGVINMGARVYDPYTGTFLQPDPDPAGDASAYGYADGDPVNNLDLPGTSSASYKVVRRFTIASPNGSGDSSTVLREGSSRWGAAHLANHPEASSDNYSNIAETLQAPEAIASLGGNSFAYTKIVSVTQWVDAFGVPVPVTHQELFTVIINQTPQRVDNEPRGVITAYGTGMFGYTGQGGVTT